MLLDVLPLAVFTHSYRLIVKVVSRNYISSAMSPVVIPRMSILQWVLLCTMGCRYCKSNDRNRSSYATPYRGMFITHHHLAMMSIHELCSMPAVPL